MYVVYHGDYGEIYFVYHDYGDIHFLDSGDYSDIHFACHNYFSWYVFCLVIIKCILIVSLQLLSCLFCLERIKDKLAALWCPHM